MIDINKSIVTILKNDSTLNSLCSKYYPLIAPDDTDTPFIVFKRSSSIDTTKEYSNIFKSDIEFNVITGENYSLGIDISKRLEEILTGYQSGNIKNIKLSSVNEEFTLDGFTQRLLFSVISF